MIITKDSDQLLWFLKAVLKVHVCMVKANSTDYANGDQVALVNSGWSLFGTAELQVNNKTVEELHQYAPTVATLMQLITASDDHSRSTATSSMWYRDTATGAHNLAEFVTGAVALPAGTVADGTNATGANVRVVLDAYCHSGT